MPPLESIMSSFELFAKPEISERDAAVRTYFSDPSPC